MKIQAIASPADIKPAAPSDAKSRAVAAFNNAQTQQQVGTPPVNQNAISSEELGAILPPKQEASPDTSTEVVEATEDTSAPTPPKEEPKDPALSRQFAQLARQERALRAKAQQQNEAFKAREAQLTAREAELTTKNTRFNPSDYVSKAQLKADPLSALNDAEVSYESLTQQILNQQPTDPRVLNTISRLENKIKQLEESAETGQKTYAEHQQAQYQAAVKQIKQDAKHLVYTDPEFETIKATGSVNDVVDLIIKTHEKDGIVLSVEEAAKEVENYLVEEAFKLTQVGKIKKRMAAANASQTKPGTKTPDTKEQTQPMKTLTNAVSSARKLSAKERAILAFKGELKS